MSDPFDLPTDEGLTTEREEDLDIQVTPDLEEVVEVEEEKAVEPEPAPVKKKKVRRPNPLRVIAAAAAAPARFINTEEVKVLQQQLRDEGFKLGRIDGKYGKKTVDAVEAFQEQSDTLSVDGVAGPATLKQLFK